MESDPQDRNVEQGVQYQGIDESIAYTLDVSAIGSGPTSVSVVVFEERDLSTPVTASVMPNGSPSVDGDVITLPALTGLAKGRRYRVEVQYTLDGNVLETWFVVEAQR